MKKAIETDFVYKMKEGLSVKTNFGNGFIKHIIDDIHCRVIVHLDNGCDKDIMLYDFENDGLYINLDYENSK